MAKSSSSDLISDDEIDREIKVIAHLIRRGQDVSELSNADIQTLYNKLNNLPAKENE